MKCRQCLIQLTRSLGKADMVPEGQETPQRDTFVGWSEHIANTIAPGDSAERIRGHPKAIEILMAISRMAHTRKRRKAIRCLIRSRCDPICRRRLWKRRDPARERKPGVLPELWIIQPGCWVQSRSRASTLRVSMRKMRMVKFGTERGPESS